MPSDCYVRVNPSFYEKLGEDWDEIMSDALDEICLKVEEQTKQECPVDTGNLMRNHNSDLGDKESKKITNDTEYMWDVIYGTSKMSDNDYPSRALQSVQPDFDEIIKKNAKKHGVK